MKKLEGLYLVLDPSQEEQTLLQKLKKSLQGGINVVQIWNHWNSDWEASQKFNLCRQIKTMAEEFEVPVFMNEDWTLALTADLDGVHFDKIPEYWNQVKNQLENKLIGLTVGNNLDLIQWADQNGVHYISFCSVFRSSSVDTCELVNPENIKKARKITQLPIFLSGGIRPENLHLLDEYSYEGVAVISGILNAKKPEKAVNNYLGKMKKLI